MFGLIALLDPLASSHDGWHHGGWWIFWLIAWALTLAVVAALVLRSRRRPHDGHTATTVLAERYARGEITETEYRERLQTLRDIDSE